MKTIKNFPNYYISEDGHVYRKRDMHEITYQKSKVGYISVYLWNNGYHKRKYVHRLVAEAYLNNSDNRPCVNHKDENKSNNNVSNLEWCTYQYNNSYGNSTPTKKAIEARKIPVVQMSLDGDIIAEYESASEAMRQTNNHQANISACCRNKIKSCGGYKWQYKQQIK